MAIINGLPKTDFQQVLQFNTAFKVTKENTHIVADFTQHILRFSLILEEAIELGFALGINKDDIYHIFTNLFVKIRDKQIKADLVEILDALTDLLYVVYGAIDVFNLANVQHDAMEEVHRSN
jgi:predicted HAD superfamily Cof-like phosphohydrolase